MDLRKSSRINDRGKNRQKLLREKALQFATDNCRIGVDFDGFQVRYINEVIGHGVFTTKQFKEGEFLLHYDGDLLSSTEARKKRRSYDPSIGTFQYEFRYREKRLCIDATDYTHHTARMVNDAPLGDPLENSFMAIVVVDKVPNLCLFAKRDIETGEELRYDYGDPKAPWRKKAKRTETMEDSSSRPNEPDTKPQTHKDESPEMPNPVEIIESETLEELAPRPIEPNTQPQTDKEESPEMPNPDEIIERTEDSSSRQSEPDTQPQTDNDQSHEMPNPVEIIESETLEELASRPIEPDAQPQTDKEESPEMPNTVEIIESETLEELAPRPIEPDTQPQTDKEESPEMPNPDEIIESERTEDSSSRQSEPDTQPQTDNDQSPKMPNPVEIIESETLEELASRPIETDTQPQTHKDESPEMPNTDEIIESETLEELAPRPIEPDTQPQTDKEESHEMPNPDEIIESERTEDSSSRQSEPDTQPQTENDQSHEMPNPVEIIESETLEELASRPIEPDTQPQTHKDESPEMPNSVEKIESERTEDSSSRQSEPDTQTQTDNDQSHEMPNPDEIIESEKMEDSLSIPIEPDTQPHTYKDESPEMPNLDKIIEAETMEDSSSRPNEPDTQPQTDNDQSPEIEKYGEPIHWSVTVFEPEDMSDECLQWQTTNTDENDELQETLDGRKNWDPEFTAIPRGKGKRTKCDYARIRKMLQNDPEDETVDESGSEYVPSDVEVEDTTSGNESEEIPYQSIEKALVRKTAKSNKPLQEQTRLTSFSHPQGQQRTERNSEKPPSVNAPIVTQDIASSSSVTEEPESSPSIATTNNVGKRKHDKKYYCLYCLKPQAKLKRHLTETKEHENEEDVVQLKALADDPKREQMLLTKLRNIGNYLHNKRVIEDGKGEINVRYRPKQSKSEVDTYGACPYCYGYFKLKYLWRHRCPLKPKVPKQPGTKQRIVSKSRVITPQVGVSSGSVLQSLISRLRADDVSRIVKSDKTIMALADKLCSNLSEDVDEHAETRQNLRRMGRLLRQLRVDTNSPNKTLVDFIDPKCFRTVCNAVRNMSQFIESTNRYKTPSLAQKIGPMIEKICDMLTTEGIEKQDPIMQQKVADFRKLYELNWSESVSRNASKTLAEEKRKKSTSFLLPLADDVKALSNYLETKANASYEILQSNPSTEERQKSWMELSESVLTHTILFSRRRAGEVSKMTIGDYERKKSADVDGPVAKTLTPLEKRLCTVLKRTIVKGKKRRPVAVIFNQQSIKYIDCLLENRGEFVDKDNNYLFARFAPSAGHIRGTDTMRDSANACGAKRPDTLRSTTLRKQIATLSQVMNLRDNELDVLARFLGHDIRVHREYYRLTDETIQVAKVAKLLINMEKGGHGLLPGQTLDTLEVEDVLTGGDEQNGAENMPNDDNDAGLTFDDDDDDDDDDDVDSSDEDEYDDEEGKTEDEEGISEADGEDKEIAKNPKRKYDKEHTLDRHQTPKRRRHAKQTSTQDDDEEEPSNKTNKTRCDQNSQKGTKRGKDIDSKQKRQRRRPYSYRPWSEDEKQAVFRHFRRAIVLQELPGKADYERCLQAEEALKNRTWTNLKDFVRNQFGKH